MENNERQLTVKDVLEDVKKMLGDISVPATLIESVGIPIARAINGIQMCVDCIRQEEVKIETDGGDSDA